MSDIYSSICVWNRAYKEGAKVTGLLVHKVGLSKRDPHGYFVALLEQEDSSVVICVVFLRLANHATETAHNGLLIDVRVMPHEERVPSVVEQLAVYEVVTRGANHQKAVADELYTTGFVAQPPIGDAVNCGKS